MIYIRYLLEIQGANMREQYLLRLPKQLKERLQEIAENKGMSLNALIMWLLDNYIKDNEIKRKENK